MTRRALRILMTLLLVWGGSQAAAATVAEEADEPHPYFPLADRASMTYVARSTLDADASLHWEVAHQQTVEADGGVDRLILRVTAPQWREGKMFQRQERYVHEPRGLFTPELGADGAYGPYTLLPPADELETLDSLWRYEGDRYLPFSFHLLGVSGAAEQPVLTRGHYHVLNAKPLTLDVGTFDEAIQVTAIEQVVVPLAEDDLRPMLLRCRRWYVRGLGLVQEIIEFPDYPRLGRLTTELVAYAGVAPDEPARQPVAVAEARTSERS